MPQQCPICSLNFQLEPGFYSGALWTSYPFVIAIIVVCWLIISLLFDASFSAAFLLSSIVALILQPIVMRIGRAVWINVFFSYRGP